MGQWSLTIILHALAGLLALVLGGFILTTRQAQSLKSHKILGAIWFASMYYLALGSIFIREQNHGGFSKIHLISLAVFISITASIAMLVMRRYKLHRWLNTVAYLLLLLEFVSMSSIPSKMIPSALIYSPFKTFAFGGGVVVLSGILIWLIRKL